MSSDGTRLIHNESGQSTLYTLPDLRTVGKLTDRGLKLPPDTVVSVSNSEFSRDGVRRGGGAHDR